MAVAARRVRSGSLSSGEDSYSDEEDSRKMKSYVTQAPPGPTVVDRKSPSPRNRGTPSSGGSPPRRKKPRYEDTPPRRKHRRRRSSSPEESEHEHGATKSSGKGSKKQEEEEPAPKRKKEEVDPILTKTGGAYIPPARLRMMQQSITDKSSVAYQRLAWEALKKSINGLINKVNVANIGNIVGELFQENVVRGRGLLARSIIQAQAASPVFTHVYAALVAVINTKFPQTGELIAKRLVSQFRKGYRRNDKNTCVTAIKFVGHLVNQQVLHEIVALEALTLLLEDPTDDSVEVAVGFLKEVGLKLIEVSPRGIHAVFETLRSVLHSGKIAPRVQYMIEVMFAIRKDQFKDHPSVLEELDLVQEDDQITHLLSLDDEFNTEEALNVFHPDPDFLANEDKYKLIKDEILGGGSDSEEGSGSSGEESSEEEDSEGEEGAEGEEGGGMDITDKTDSKVLGIRRTIYLTIMSSLDFEECAHKLIKNLVEGMEGEVAYMLIECCSQERSYLRFYGLLGQRLCLLNQVWVEKFDEAFQQQYSTVHRLETNKLRNVAKFFGQLFYADALPWTCMSCIHLNEEETNSSSRIFVKILFQELSEFMGLTKLNERLRDPLLTSAFEGLLPRDNPKNTRFAINFFTSIGLGGLTDDLREHLKNAQKLIMAQRQEVSSSDTDSSSEESSEEEDSSSSEEDSSSESESSESSEEEKKRRKKRERSSRERSSRGEDQKKKRSRGSRNSEKARRRAGDSEQQEEGRSRRIDKDRDNGRARERRERRNSSGDDERRQDRDSEERSRRRDAGRVRERRKDRKLSSDDERKQDRGSEGRKEERSRGRGKGRDNGRARERRERRNSSGDDERRQDRDSEEGEEERSRRRDAGRARERHERRNSSSDDERRQDRDSEEGEEERSRRRDNGKARERDERRKLSSDDEKRQDRDSDKQEEERSHRRDAGRARERRERRKSSSGDERRQGRDSEEERSRRRDAGRARERRERRNSSSDDERRQDRDHDRKRKEESGGGRKDRGRERREADDRGERDRFRGSPGPREDKRNRRREDSEERDRERGRNRERDRDRRRRDERR